MGITTEDQPPRVPRRGVIDGASRVLRELLRTPRVRRSIEIVLNDLDPENAPGLVRALTEDHALFLDLVSAAPAAANASIGAARELLAQVMSEPEGLLRDVMVRLLGDIDAERLGRTAGLGLGLVLRLGRDDEVRRAVEDLRSGVRRGFSAALEELGVDEGALERPRSLWERFWEGGGLVSSEGRADER